MKKYIIVLSIIWLTSVSPAYAMTAQQEASLRSVIADLLKQVAVLVEQLNAIKVQEPTIAKEIPATIQLSNRITTIMETPIDKSDILIVKSNGNVSLDFPHGQIIFTVTVLDSSGKPAATKLDATRNITEAVNVQMTVPDTFNDKNLTDTRITNEKGEVVFGYIPKTTGEKTITFTSGNVSKNFVTEVR